MNGVYKIQHIRAGKILSERVEKNLIPDIGANAFLDVVFNSAAKYSFFISLINAPITASSILATDTMAAHPGWTENPDYTEATRRAWIAARVIIGTYSNVAAVAVFNFAVPCSINGFFMASENVKSGTAGVLLSALRTLPVIAILAGDSIRVTYSVTL